MKDLSKIPLFEFIDLLAKASKENNQELVNELALEVVRRIYVPNPKKTKEELLAEFGYKEIEKPKEKRKWYIINLGRGE